MTEAKKLVESVAEVVDVARDGADGYVIARDKIHKAGVVVIDQGADNYNEPVIRYYIVHSDRLVECEDLSAARWELLNAWLLEERTWTQSEGEGIRFRP